LTLRSPIFTLAIFALFVFPIVSWGQGMYTPFGQSRVQYGKFEWSYVRSENFDAYHYVGGRELAQFAARTCETELNGVEKLIDHRLSGRVEIIVYNTLSDYKQTNLNVLSDQSQNPGGYSQVVSNKIFVYFNGNHEDFVNQLKAGLSLVLMNELLFGGSIQDRIQNAALLNLPDWFLFGLSKNWDVNVNNKMKDYILTKKVKKFNRLIYNDPELAGQAFWRFLTEKYGTEVIANMLYVSRLSRNYETALIYVTGENLKKTSKDLIKYFQEQYNKEDTLRNLPTNTFKIKKRLTPYVEPQMKVSPRGDKLIFSTNKYGKYKIWLMDTKTGKQRKVHRGGFKYHMFELDHSFPMMSWHPGGEKFAFVFEKKGKIFLTTVDLISKKKETIRFFKFDKINSFAYSENERTLVFSATRKGQSDLYVYDLNTRRERQLTNDVHDDLFPRFVEGSSKIIFSSNRNSNLVAAPAGPTLPQGNNLDIYLYDFETNSDKLIRLTNTPNINETEPLEYNNSYFGYLSEYNGIKNRYVSRYEEEYDFTELNIKYLDDERANDTLYFDVLKNLGTEFEYEGKTIRLDSSIEKIDTIVHNKTIVYTYPITNYKRNIIAHDVSKQSKTVYETIFDNGKYTIRYSPWIRNIEEESSRIETYPTMFRLKSGYANKPFVSGAITYSSRKPKQEAGVSASGIKQPAKPIVKYNYLFLSEFPIKNNIPAQDGGYVQQESPVKLASAKGFKLAAPSFYNITFFPDHLVTQLDNSIINTYYQPIGLSNPFAQSIQPMIKFGIIDLLEDYRITGGFRLPFNVSTVDYFASLETLKRRFDHKLSYYRQVRLGVNGEFPAYSARNISQELRYSVRFPFLPTFCVRTEFFVRRDQTSTLAQNRQSLDIPSFTQRWVGGKVELVFDNAIPKGLNLWNGTKFKVFYEHYEDLDNKNGQLNTVGFDFRHYQKLHRQLILATRVTYNTSFGPSRVKYVLGGVDNWISAKQEDGGNSPTSVNYSFQALATNLRGFKQNIRSGNSFAVVNTEIRWPIFTYLFNRPIRNEFISNFQIVPFFDIGTAWVGPDPYSEENTYNQIRVVENQYLNATVINVRDPIVAGYGSGLRTKFLGYFIRFDAAWGVQDLEASKKPIYYFSLSLDF
jgi:Tol biopolymer transport system component